MPALGKALIGLPEGQPGGRAGRRGRVQRSEFEVALLRLLGESGCPICHQSEDHDRKYFFWFLNENYFEPFTIVALTRSLGFCLAHGDTLVQTLRGGDQLRYVHQILTQQARRALAQHRRGQGHRRVRTPPLRRVGPCPVCQSRWAAEDRNLHVLAGLLGYPEGIDRYGRPGLLCFGHLQRVAPRLSDGVFLRTLEIHRAAIRAALDTLAAAGVPPEARARQGDQALALSVGRDLAPDPYPSPQEYRAPIGLWDPVAEFLDALRGDACAICLEERRAWLEWTAWLEAAAGREEAPEDLLPTCPAHVWPLIHRGSAQLAAAVTRHALAAALAEVEMALPRRPPPARHWLERIAEAPVDAQDLLVEVEDGKLAVLYWELVEAGRKAAWHVRPETKGREAQAWRRAVVRFSGSLGLPGG